MKSASPRVSRLASLGLAVALVAGPFAALPASADEVVAESAVVEEAAPAPAPAAAAPVAPAPEAPVPVEPAPEAPAPAPAPAPEAPATEAPATPDEPTDVVDEPAAVKQPARSTSRPARSGSISAMEENTIGDPTAPTITSAEAIFRGIFVEWEAPTPNGSGYGDGYNLVEYSLAGENEWIFSVNLDPSSTVWLIDDLQPGTTYDVRVTASDTEGTRGGAAYAYGIMVGGVPSEPQNPVATASGSEITVTWDVPIVNGNLVESYTVYYNDTEDFHYFAATVTATSFTLEDTIPGHTYAFTVQANGIGQNHSELSDTVTATAPDAPAAVTELTATGLDSAVRLDWEAVDGAESYYVEYRESTESGDGNYLAWFEVEATTSTITGLVNGTVYDFRVAALDGGVQGEFATTTWFPFGTPGEVENFGWWPNDGGASLYWDSPVDLGGRGITGYDLEVFDADDDLVAEFSVENGYAELAGLTNGHDYDVYIRAVNGSVVAAEFAFVGTVTPATAPSAPVITSLQAHSTTLDVTWDAPTSDGSLPITGYQVRWAPTGTSSCDNSMILKVNCSMSVPSGFSAWKYANADGTSLTISGLTNSISYDVQVRAFNETFSSGWSQRATGTPFTFEPTFTRTDGSSVGGTEVRAGDIVVIAGDGSLPGQTVFAELHSKPIKLGSGVVADDGSFSFEVTIPAGAPAGNHEIYASLGSAGLLIADADVDVRVEASAVDAPSDAAADAAAAGSGVGSLAVTGVAEAELASNLIASALLLVVGIALLATRRRRSTPRR